MTAREIIAGKLAGILERIRWFLLFPIFVAILLPLLGYLSWTNSLITTVTWLLFAGFVMPFGLICSVMAKRAHEALFASIGFLVMATMGTAVLRAQLDDSSGIALMYVAGILVCVGVIWASHTENLCSLTLLLGSVFFFATTFVTGWRVGFGHKVTFLTPWLVPYYPEYFEEFHSNITMYHLPFSGRRNVLESDIAAYSLVSVWLAMLLVGLWTRHWLIRNFDKWSGRVG